MIAALALLALLASAQSATPVAAPAASGTVFLDRNANGARDAGEPGIANVAVSNQDAVVVTDASGAFRLPAGGTGVVFVSVPDGHRAVGAFWRAAPADGAALSFALAAAPGAREFTFVHASDPHVSERSLPRIRRLRAVVDSLAPAFALITGDLVRDALRVPEAEARGYYEMFEREAREFRAPVFTVPGNHEIFGIEPQAGVPPTHPLRNRGMYRHYRGPDYYSFTHGGVHFVALNTVNVHEGTWYHGGVDSVQLAWLRRDLERVPAGMPVVTYDHIPFYTTVEVLNGYTDQPPAPTLITIGGRATYRHTVENATEVLAALRERNHVLALGGHVHVRELIRFEVEGVSVRFEQSAATVATTEAAGRRFTSGVTLYTVRDGVIDAGRFVPLDPPAAARD